MVLLFIWDGLGFFGFDDTKLARLKGKPVTFMVKFTSIRWVVLTFVTSVALILLMLLEGRKFGEEKSKSISLVQSDEFHYDVRQALPLRMIQWLWLAQLLPKIQEYQNANWNNPDVKQHGESRLIRLNYEEFNWFDHSMLEWFICNHTKVFYREKDYFSAIGYGVWEEISDFNFKCQITYFANDKIRTMWFLPMGEDEAISSFTNTNPAAALIGGGKLLMDYEERKKMNFIRSNTFR